MSILSIGELLDLGNSAATAGLVPYSALEYNETGAISGISGSAIAGGVDTTIVSAIASSYVDSGMSGKADQSALDNCCSAMSAVVSGKLDASASGQFQPSGNYQPSGDYYSATNPSGFITTADITGKLDNTASSLFQPSGDYADASSLYSKLDASASGMFAPSGNYQSAGDYAFNSSLSSKLDASASSDFYLASNPSGFITGVDLDGYATTGYVESSVSGKLDASASGKFQPSGSYAYESSLTSYIPFSAVSGESNQITAINGSAIGNGGGGESFTGVVTDDTLTGNGLPNSALGVDGYGILFDSSLYSSLDGDNVTIGVQTGIYATTGYVDSSVSGKQDTLTFSYDDDDKISAINGSALAGQGGATGDYVEKSATEVSIGTNNTASDDSFAQGVYNSAASYSFAQGGRNTAHNHSFAQGEGHKADLDSFAQGFYNTASACSFAQGDRISARNTAAVFGKYNLRGDGNTATGNSAAFAIGDGTGYDARHDLMLVTKDGEITMYSGIADTTGTGIMSSIRTLSANKLDSSASSSFYTTDNPSGFVTTAYVDSSVSGKQDTLTFAYDDDKISSINGSALAGGGGGGDLRVASPSGTILVTNGTSIEGTNRAIGSGVKSAVNVIESASTTILSLTAYASASSQISVTSPSAYGLGICYESSNVGRSVNITAHYSGYNTASAVLELPGSSTSAGVLIGNNTAKITGVGIKAGNRSITLSGSYPILLCEPAVSVRELVCLDELSSYVNIKQKTNIEYGLYAFASGTNTIAIGNQASAINAGSIAFGDHTKADFYSFAIGNDCVANGRSIAWGSATANVSSTAIGHGISAINRSIVLGYLNNSGNGAGDRGVALAIGDGTASTARHDLMVVTKNGEITMYSSTADTVGTGVMDSIRSLSAAVSGVTALLDAI